MRVRKTQAVVRVEKIRQRDDLLGGVQKIACRTLDDREWKSGGSTGALGGRWAEGPARGSRIVASCNTVYLTRCVVVRTRTETQVRSGAVIARLLLDVGMYAAMYAAGCMSRSEPLMSGVQCNIEGTCRPYASGRVSESADAD